MSRGRHVAMFLAIAFGLQGCASAPPRVTRALPRAPIEAPDLATLDTLAVGDSLSLRFPYRPEYNERVGIRSDGRIGLPLIGSVQAAGRTAEDTEAEVRRDYGKIAYDPSRPVAGKEYLISTGDQLEIRFRDAEKLNSDVTVRPDGKISLSLVKAVTAEGKTPEQLERELIQRYGAILKNPDLVVIVHQYTSERYYVGGTLTRPGIRDLDSPSLTVHSLAPRQVFVAGEVRNPGFVPYQPPLTALQAIIAVGGFVRSSKLSHVLVLRKVGTARPTATFLNLSTDVKGLTNNDMSLRPFDIVIVPKSKITQIADFIDQYLYQLIPAARTVNFGFFYDLKK